MKSTEQRGSLLLPYQIAWAEDDSKLKIVSKGRQEGFTFGAAFRVARKGVGERSRWVILSRSERQSALFMDAVQQHLNAMGVIAETVESDFFLENGQKMKQLEKRLGNGTVIFGLPANPETARGHSGNVVLDEFAFHKDPEKIYGAIYPATLRGYSVEIISTPNGKQGMYYELAKEAGLVDGQRSADSYWSAHLVDIWMAVEQGLAETVPPVRKPPEKWIAWAEQGFRARGMELLKRRVLFMAATRAGIRSDDIWQQEFEGAFLSTAENFFPPELIDACVRPEEASVEVPLSMLEQEPGEFFCGVDIGRKHDLTVFWIDRVLQARVRDITGREEQKQVSTARHIRSLARTPFRDQMKVAHEILSAKKSTGEYLIRRICLDANGIGAQMSEDLQREFGGRVEPVTFTNVVKEDMAYRTKRLAENGQLELPDSDNVRHAFGAIKRTTTVSGNIRFDAARTDAGHADEFWAKALADLAAEAPSESFSRDAWIGGVPVSPGISLESGLFETGGLQ